MPQHAAVFLLTSFILGNDAAADDGILRFACHWDAGGSAYDYVLTVDLARREVTRSDGGATGLLLEANESAIWLKIERDFESYIAIHVIERSGEGGSLTDVIVLSDGEALYSTGGYCREL